VTAAARIVGIAGGVFGIIFGAIGMAIGGVGVGFGSHLMGAVMGVSIAAMVLAVIGIVGAVMADADSILPFLLMLIPGVAGFACITVFWLLPGILLVAGSALAYAGRKRAKSAAVAGSSLEWEAGSLAPSRKTDGTDAPSDTSSEW
jgi:hypothetical protein